MFRERISSFSIICSLAILGMTAWLIFLPQMQIIPAVLICLSFVVVLFVNRIDIAFYITIVLWMMRIAVPLGIASPFGEGGADLPLYELFTAFLGLCLLVRVAMRQESMPNSPLKIPMLVWFSLIILTYFRNPVFLGDLSSGGGMGVIYHIIYKFFLCAIFYIAASIILKTEERIILTAKTMLVVMAVGMLVMIFMFLTGWNIPFLTGGIAPWSIITTPHEGETVYRIMSMSSYSSSLILVILCFGSNLQRIVQVLFSLFLICSLVLGGGRTSVIMCFIYLSLSFIIQHRTRWLVCSLSLLLIFIFSVAMFLGTRLPHTAQRVMDFSTGSTIGIGGRLTMAKESSEPIMKRPLVGYGYGQVQKYFPNISKLIISGNPHSGLVSVMLAYGLVGLSIFLWLFLTSIRTSWMLYKNLEDGFLRQLMLWITLHLSASLVIFFISAEIERNIITYLEMGVISSVYAMFVRERLPLCLGSSEQLFLQHTTNSEKIAQLSERTV
ncbi:MAG: O-antigen ligase family protein [Planctomycetota bacterium]|jgi:hypothetical protein